jgi:hypothetical protein
LSNALIFSAAHVAGHVFKIYSHIATFPSRVATALMQLTGDYLPFQQGRISRFPPFCPFVVGKINYSVGGSLNSVYVEMRTFTFAPNVHQMFKIIHQMLKKIDVCLVVNKPVFTQVSLFP